MVALPAKAQPRDSGGAFNNAEMNCQMDENQKADGLDDLIKAGLESYLDAFYALDRFTREVTSVAVEVLTARLPALAGALDTVAQPDKIGPYVIPDKFGRNNYAGNWAWVMAEICFAAPLECNCYLGITYQRDTDSDSSSPNVTFVFTSERLAGFQKFEGIFSGKDHFSGNKGDRTCSFSWVLKAASDFTAHGLKREFEKMMDYVMTVLPSRKGSICRDSE